MTWKNSPYGLVSPLNISRSPNLTSTCVAIIALKHGKCFLFLKYIPIHAIFVSEASTVKAFATR